MMADFWQRCSRIMAGCRRALTIMEKTSYFLDEDMLHKSNVLAGGCPVLFPFPSRTKNDTYTLNGKAYTMPFHGLVKCSSFGVVETKKTVRHFISQITRPPKVKIIPLISGWRSRIL